MKFIEPSVELWKQGDTIEDIWKHIARCVRVCYQSTPKNENESEEAFVKRVILRNEPMWSQANHLAMLEHGTIYLKIPKDNDDAYHYGFDRFSRVTEETGGKYEYITTNLRVIVERQYESDLQYLCEPTPYHDRRYTFCFTTNIGVSREFNRHRVNSIAEESTRFCNYSKDKFDKQITYGLSEWLLGAKETIEYYSPTLHDLCQDIYQQNELIDENWADLDYYMFALNACEFAYNGLIKKGWLPQQAREVLPLATKTQLVHTAFEDDWKYFIALRSDGVSGKPHPNAKILADKVAEILTKLREVK